MRHVARAAVIRARDEKRRCDEMVIHIFAVYVVCCRAPYSATRDAPITLPFFADYADTPPMPLRLHTFTPPLRFDAAASYADVFAVDICRC